MEPEAKDSDPMTGGLCFGSGLIGGSGHCTKWEFIFTLVGAIWLSSTFAGVGSGKGRVITTSWCKRPKCADAFCEGAGGDERGGEAEDDGGGSMFTSISWSTSIALSSPCTLVADVGGLSRESRAHSFTSSDRMPLVDSRRVGGNDLAGDALLPECGAGTLGDVLLVPEASLVLLEKGVLFVGDTSLVGEALPVDERLVEGLLAEDVLLVDASGTSSLPKPFLLL